MTNTNLKILHLEGLDNSPPPLDSDKRKLDNTQFFQIDNCIGDEGLMALSKALHRNGHITEFYIWSEQNIIFFVSPQCDSFFFFLFAQKGNNIGDEGAKAISEALKFNTTLTSLGLGRTLHNSKLHVHNS